MKDFNGEIEYKGKIYKLYFNFNVMQQIQKEYGSLDKWGELSDGGFDDDGNPLEPNAGAVIFGFTEMINEGIDIENEENGTDIKSFTLKQVGRIITEIGLQEASNALHNTVTESTKSDEKNV